MHPNSHDSTQAQAGNQKKIESFEKKKENRPWKSERTQPTETEKNQCMEPIH
jgi:hypothetical protein